MGTIRKLYASQKTRFGLVGVINTFIDIGILNFLVIIAGVPLVVSNAASTTVAMAGSFFLNKKAVFHSDGWSRRQVALFIIVTASGLWIVQTAVVVWGYLLLGPLPEELRLNAAKAIGIVCSLAWNYFWYSRFVFRQD